MKTKHEGLTCHSNLVYDERRFLFLYTGFPSLTNVKHDLFKNHGASELVPILTEPWRLPVLNDHVMPNTSLFPGCVLLLQHSGHVKSPPTESNAVLSDLGAMQHDRPCVPQKRTARNSTLVRATRTNVKPWPP